MIVYPLVVQEGTSRHRSGPFWYLNDANGQPIASSGNEEKGELFHELAALTQQLVDGSEVEIEVLRRDRMLVKL